MSDPVYDYPVICDACGLPIDGCTTDIPPASQRGGHLHDACAEAREEERRASYAADYAAVVALGLTPDQARLVKESSQWASLPDGKRAAVQAVIDASAPQV